MRQGAGALACAAALMLAPLASADQITHASLSAPTTRYAHGVFGDEVTFGALVLTLAPCPGCAGSKEVTFTLPDTSVFEDREARLADLDGDGAPEVVVVETDSARGASLAVYDAAGKRAATVPVGQPRRWLAPAGIGDFDGMGGVEIAYVDRPHLARELVIVRYQDGALREIARVGGLTNHRFGEAEISGGVRRCGGKESLVLASGDWGRVVEVVLAEGLPVLRDLGPISGLSAAMGCP